MQPIDIEQVKRVSGKLGRQNPPQVPLTSPALAKSQKGIQELVRSQLGESRFAGPALQCVGRLAVGGCGVRIARIRFSAFLTQCQSHRRPAVGDDNVSGRCRPGLLDFTPLVR